MWPAGPATTGSDPAGDSTTASRSNGTNRYAGMSLARSGRWGRLWALFLALACLGEMGAGDVRLAPVLGAHLGHAGLTTVAIGTAAAFARGAVIAIGLTAAGNIRQDRRIPFGPGLLSGAVLALLV
ncbi:MAG: hypothetical protein ACRDRK_16800 [Pseudonocardia sp.]